MRVRFRDSAEETKCFSWTVLVGLDELGRNQVAHCFALIGDRKGHFPRLLLMVQSRFDLLYLGKVRPTWTDEF